MTQERYATLYRALTDKYPEYGFQYDGKDTISVPVHIFMCSDIWISILNEDDDGDEPSWSTCIELKGANGRLWERQLNVIISQWQSIDELIAGVEKGL